MKKITILAVLVLLSCNQNKNLENNQDTLNSAEIEKIAASKEELSINQKGKVSLDLLIIPGKSIGETNLLDDSATLEKFGKPSFSDAAMGKAWTVWTGKGLDVIGNKAALAVYTTYNRSDMSKKVVKRIRITSPDFKTSKGAHTGMTLEDIEKLYPNLELDSKMSNSEFSKGTKFYIIKEVGISFEFQTIENSQICSAIAIASADEISNQPYLLLDSAEIQR